MENLLILIAPVNLPFQKGVWDFISQFVLDFFLNALILNMNKAADVICVVCDQKIAEVKDVHEKYFPRLNL